jgi:hypothetical protein
MWSDGVGDERLLLDSKPGRERGWCSGLVRYLILSTTVFIAGSEMRILWIAQTSSDWHITLLKRWSSPMHLVRGRFPPQIHLQAISDTSQTTGFPELHWIGWAKSGSNVSSKKRIRMNFTFRNCLGSPILHQISKNSDHSLSSLGINKFQQLSLKRWEDHARTRKRRWKSSYLITAISWLFLINIIADENVNICAILIQFRSKLRVDLILDHFDHLCFERSQRFNPHSKFDIVISLFVSQNDAVPRVHRGPNIISRCFPRKLNILVFLSHCLMFLATFDVIRSFRNLFLDLFVTIFWANLLSSCWSEACQFRDLLGILFYRMQAHLFSSWQTKMIKFDSKAFPFTTFVDDCEFLPPAHSGPLQDD